MKYIIAACLLLFASDALAQYQRATDQQTVYGPDGKIQSRIQTDSQGSRTIYDANSGRILGRTSTDSQGTTVIYDAHGNRVGSITGKTK